MDCCTVCGESAVVEDVGTDGLKQRVCAECGVVFNTSMDHLHLEVGPNPNQPDWLFGDQSLPKHMRRMLQEKKELEAHRIGIQRIYQHGSMLGLSEVMVQECKEMFSKAYKECFLKRYSKLKLVLASCCVYCVCRMHSFGVAIYQICDLAQCSAPEFGHVYKELCQFNRLEMPAYSIGSSIAAIIHSLNMDNRDLIIKKTQKVLHLVEKNWLLTGRHPARIITPALYIVWKSQDFPARRKTDFSDFCRENKLALNTTTKQRSAEIHDLLIRLSRNIPWVGADSVCAKNVPVYLDDILKYQRSLMMAELCNSNHTTNDDDCPENENDSIFLPPVLKKRRLLGVAKASEAAEPEPVTEICRDLDGEELTEADLDDSDLAEYIRDPAEVEEITQIKQYAEIIQYAVNE